MRLRRQGSLHTSVHSVFQSASNLTDGAELIAVLGPSKRMNPYAVMIEDMSWFSTLALGQPVTIVLGEPLAGAYFHPVISITEKDTQVFLPWLPKGVFSLAMSINQIAQYLFQHHSEIGIYSLLALREELSLQKGHGYYAKPMEQFFMPRLHAFIDALAMKEPRISLTDFIGFGAGLTPSSDDLLVGLLSWLDYTNHPYFSTLAHACQASLAATTAVSATMLSLTTNHTYNADIIDVYHAFNGQKTLRPALDNLLQYGHSSGHDTLCGLYLGICLFPVALSQQ